MTGTWRGGAITMALVAIVGALLAVQLLDPWKTDTNPAPKPWPVSAPSADGVMIGVTTLALARNSARAWTPHDLVEVNDFEQRAHLHADVVMWFCDWANCTFDPRQAASVRRRGSVPEISWEPWDSRIAPGRAQPAYRLAQIIAGRYDALIRRFARAVKRYGGPVRLRFAQEMNGRLYPWAEGANGNRSGQFADAWRHVHDIFTAVDVTNVTWIWAPVVGGVTARQYPGDPYVDVLGLSGFNGGSAVFAKRWRPFRATFAPSLDALHHLAPAKPLALSEIASAEQGGSKAQWITDMVADVAARPTVHELVWFDVDKEVDWRISSSSSAQAAFARAAGALRR